MKGIGKFLSQIIKRAIVEATTEDGNPEFCYCIASAALLMKVPWRTVKYGYETKRPVIKRRVDGAKVFQLKWLDMQSLTSSLSPKMSFRFKLDLPSGIRVRLARSLSKTLAKLVAVAVNDMYPMDTYQSSLRIS